MTTIPPSTVPLVARGPRAWRGGLTQWCLCKICTVQHLIWPIAHWNLPFGPIKSTLQPGPAHSALRSHKSAGSFTPAPGATSTGVLWSPPAAGTGAGPHSWSRPACCLGSGCEPTTGKSPLLCANNFTEIEDISKPIKSSISALDPPIKSSSNMLQAVKI